MFNAPRTSHNSQEEGHILHVGDPALPELGGSKPQIPSLQALFRLSISSCNQGDLLHTLVAQLILLSELQGHALPKLPGGQGPLLPPHSPLAQCMTRVMCLLYSVSSKHMTHSHASESLPLPRMESSS